MGIGDLDYGTIKEYDNNDKLILECEYLKEEKSGKGKNIILIMNWNLKENI